MGATTSIALQQEIDKPLDASDLGTPQSAIQEVARLRKLMHPPAPRPLKGVMVDCGSGHTSIMCYTHTAGGQTNQHAKLSIRQKGGNYPLTDAFSNDTTAHFIHQLNQALSTLIDFHPDVLFVGATGGVRKAIQNNDITQAQVEAFVDQLTAAFSATVNVVQFQVLDGTTEARYELKAAQLIWGGANAPLTGTSIGLFSGGGQSMQLGRLNEEPLSFPFSTMVAEFEERSGASPDSWLDPVAWKKFEDDLIANVAIEQTKRKKFEGCYVGTAMNHRAAAYSGISETPMQAREVVATLRATLPQFRNKSGPLYDTMMASRKGGAAHHNYPLARIAALHTLRLAITLDMLFSPEAEFFFAKNGLDPAGNAIDCEWTLGAFLEVVGSF